MLTISVSAVTQEQIDAAILKASSIKNDILQDKIEQSQTIEELQGVGSGIEQAEFAGYLTEYETSDAYVYRESVLAEVDPVSLPEEELAQTEAGPVSLKELEKGSSEDEGSIISADQGGIALLGLVIIAIGFLVFRAVKKRKERTPATVEVKDDEQMHTAQEEAAQLSSHMNHEIRNLLAVQEKKDRYIKFHHKIALELLEGGRKEPEEADKTEHYTNMMAFFEEMRPEEIIKAPSDDKAKQNIEVNRRALMQTNPALARQVPLLIPELMLLRKHFNRNDIIPVPDVVKHFVRERERRRKLIEQLERNIAEIAHLIIHEGPTALENVARFRKRDLETLRLLEGRMLHHIEDLVPAARITKEYGDGSSALEEHEIVTLLQKEQHEEKELAHIIKHILSLIGRLQTHLDLVGKELQKQTKDILPRQRSDVREVRKSYDDHLSNDTTVGTLAEGADELKESWERESELTQEFIDIAGSLSALQKKAHDITEKIRAQRRQEGTPEHAPLRSEVLLDQDGFKKTVQSATDSKGQWEGFIQHLAGKHVLYSTKGERRSGRVVDQHELKRLLQQSAPFTLPVLDNGEHKVVMLDLRNTDRFQVYQ